MVASLLLVFTASALGSTVVLEYAPASESFPVKAAYTGGAVVFELGPAEQHLSVHCDDSSGQGEITGALKSTVEITYTGCTEFESAHQSQGPSTCQSVGAQEGEIKIGPLEAELVYIDKVKGEVGTLLNPGGGTYLAYECAGELHHGRGAIVSPMTPINQEVTTLTQTFDSPNIREYENAKGEFFSAMPEGSLKEEQFAEMGLSALYVVNVAAPIEIKAGIKPGNIGASHGVPQIEGSAAAGEQLTCWHGLWDGTPTPTYSYEWFRNGFQVGATTSAYTVRAADQGDTLTCEVAARNDLGEQDATSPGVHVAQAPPFKAGEGAAQEKTAAQEAAAKNKQEEEAASKVQPLGQGSATVSLDGSTIGVQGGGTAGVKLTCTGTGACTGKLTLTAREAAKKSKKSKAEVIGTAAFSLSAGSTATVKLTLDAAGRSLLKADRGKLSASLAIFKSSPTPSQANTDSVRLVEKVMKARMKKR